MVVFLCRRWYQLHKVIEFIRLEELPKLCLPLQCLCFVVHLLWKGCEITIWIQEAENKKDAVELLRLKSISDPVRITLDRYLYHWLFTFVSRFQWLILQLLAGNIFTGITHFWNRMLWTPRRWWNLWNVRMSWLYRTKLNIYRMTICLQFDI